MANTKTYTGGSKSSSPWREIRIVLEETATSVSNNTSTISYEVWLDNGNTYFSQIKIGCKVVIDGTTVLDRAYGSSSQYSASQNASVKIASGTTTVTHGSDGKKTIASGKISASCSSAGVVASQTVTSNSAWALTDIARASSVSISTNTTIMGQARTLTITRSDSSFTHTLTYTFGSATGTIATKTSSTSVSFTPPTSLASQLTNAKSGTGTITCTTYSGNTSIGTSTCSFTATIPASTVAISGGTWIGDAMTFTITRASTALTHKIEYKFATQTANTSLTSSAGASYSWTPSSAQKTAMVQAVATNNASGSGTITLTTYNGTATVGTSTKTWTGKIPASTLAVGSASVTMGGSQTFTITSAGTNITHTLTYAFGSLTGQSIGTGITTSKSWTVPTSLASQLSNAKQGTVTVTITTYNGTAACGSTSTKTFTAVAPVSTMTLSATSINLNSALTVTIARATTNMTHTLAYSFVGATGTVGSSLTTSASWTPAYTLASQIPSATSGTCTLTLTTYIGTASVGTSTKTLTLKVPNNSTTQPTLTSSTLAPSSSLSSPFNNIFIANYTKLKATVSASGKYSATIASYAITVDGVTKSQAASPITTANNLTTSGTIAVTTKITDSRGFTKSSSQNITVYEYNEPYVNPKTGATKVVCARSNSGGTLASNGTYLHIEAGRTISSLNSNNQGKLSYVVYNSSNTQVASGDITGNATTVTTSSTWTSSTAILSSVTSTYRVVLTATDTFGNSSTYTVNIPTDTVTMDFRSGGTGVGIGMYSQGNNRLDVAWPSYFNGASFADTVYNLANRSAGSASRIRPVGTYSHGDLGLASGMNSAFFEAWIKKVCEDYPTDTYMIYVGTATPNTRGVIMCEIYNTSTLTDGLPEYATGCYYHMSNNGRIYTFGTYAYNFFYHVYRPDTEQFSSSVTWTDNAVIAEAGLTSTLRKQGEIVTLDLILSPTGTSGGSAWVNIGTIPSGYRPQGDVTIITPVFSATYSYAVIQARSSGVLRIWKNNTSTSSFNANMTWICNSIAN